MVSSGETESCSDALGLGVTLDRSSWNASPVFAWLEEAGVAPAEMYRSFNCGIGMIAITDEDRVDAVIASLQGSGESASVIGRVVGSPGVTIERT